MEKIWRRHNLALIVFGIFLTACAPPWAEPLSAPLSAIEAQDRISVHLGYSGTVTNVTKLPEPWPCPQLESQMSADIAVARFDFIHTNKKGASREMFACAVERKGGQMGWGYYPRDLAGEMLDKLHQDMKTYVTRHLKRGREGYFPDGSPMGADCRLMGIESCLAHDFLMRQGIVRSIPSVEVAGLMTASLLIDVRGPTERKNAPLKDIENIWIQYGSDSWTPMPVMDLDREAFADETLNAAGSKNQPIIAICSKGIRSAAAVAALREAGFSNVSSVKDGALGNYYGPGILAI